MWYSQYTYKERSYGGGAVGLERLPRMREFGYSIDRSQKIFMYSLTSGHYIENEAKLGFSSATFYNMAEEAITPKRDEYCCVPQCNGNARIHNDLSFHRIPSLKKPELRKRWIIAIRRDEGPLFKVNMLARAFCLQLFFSLDDALNRFILSKNDDLIYI